MPNAVIVAHGQPSDAGTAEASLAKLAARIDDLTCNVTVTSATLAAPEALENTLDRLSGETRVYPLFMAKGWFVTSVLPKRIGHRRVQILDPLGVDPDLPELVAKAISAQVSCLGWKTSTTDLLIAAHGSGRSRAPARETNSFANRLGVLLHLNSIRCGFVEELPSIHAAAREVGSNSICLPFFACAGGHVLEDVPSELNKAGFQGHVMPVVGELDGVQRRIAYQLDRTFEAG
ncbi:MAG: CbiX/SirB N-terminal domain-containing protein [Ruegeria sp.]